MQDPNRRNKENGNRIKQHFVWEKAKPVSYLERFKAKKLK